MRKRLSRLTIWPTVGWAAVLAAIVAAGATGMLDRVFVYFPQRELNASPATYGLAYDDAWFTTEDGVRVHGWFVPGQGEITWLWFPGNAGNISDRLQNLKQLHDRLDVNILLFDYRGYGQSQGAPSEKGIYRDADAALAYLRSRQDVDADRIVYFGRSLGATIAVDLAHREPPYGLVLESSLPSIAFVAQQAFPIMPKWLVGIVLRARYDALSKIGNVEAPVLFLHGDRDEVVPISAGKRLFDAAMEPPRCLGVVLFYALALIVEPGEPILG